MNAIREASSGMDFQKKKSSKHYVRLRKGLVEKVHLIIWWHFRRWYKERSTIPRGNSMTKGAKVGMARVRPGHDESICIWAKCPEDFSWPGRTGVQGALRTIVEEQAGKEVGWRLNFSEVSDIVCLTMGSLMGSWTETIQAADVNWIERAELWGRKS